MGEPGSWFRTPKVTSEVQQVVQIMHLRWRKVEIVPPSWLNVKAGVGGEVPSEKMLEVRR